MHSVHRPHNILFGNTVDAALQSGDWEYCHFDTVLINKDPSKVWPQSGLNGMYMDGNIEDLTHI